MQYYGNVNVLFVFCQLYCAACATGFEVEGVTISQLIPL